ncbi:MAG: ABC transporter permease [Betaproteobacteria bacterium]|nr:ABC transporter permease [Betaproteobacteria bacterium]
MNEVSSSETVARAALEKPPAVPGALFARLFARVRNRPEWVCLPLTLVLVIGGWEWYVAAYKVSTLILPPPSHILSALHTGLASGVYVKALLVTLQAILLGFLLSASVAFILGTLISQVRLIEATIYPYVVALQTLPKIAIAPLILVWVGLGIESKIIIAALVSFFPMLVNTIVGLKSASADKLELMHALTASRIKTFFLVKLPEALPYIFAGLQIGIVLAVLGAIVGEFVGAKAGLGYLIIQMNYTMDVAGMFAVLVILGVMGVVLNVLIAVLRKRVIFWQRTDVSAI